MFKLYLFFIPNISNRNWTLQWSKVAVPTKQKDSHEIKNEFLESDGLNN